jgi:hypothetical protein
VTAGWTQSGCHVCAQELGEFLTNGDVIRFVCPACGEYFISDTAREVLDKKNNPRWWTSVRRATLAHFLRNRRNLPFWKDTGKPFIRSADLTEFEKIGLTAPNRLAQADNAIRYLGDQETRSGAVPDELPQGLWALIGCSNADSMANLFVDIAIEGLAASSTKREDYFNDGQPPVVIGARLSLRGWQRWSELQQGATLSRDGFIAMQFGDDRLDTFVREAVQGKAAATLGRKIHRVDSPDRLEAGLIDNIMREAIEDAAFVLVELSHGNRGAYWEAGFAEGLRKPVIYLCERAKWDNPETRPHFDVNHRTTIMWDVAKTDDFVAALVATVNNSLREKAT